MSCDFDTSHLERSTDHLEFVDLSTKRAHSVLKQIRRIVSGSPGSHPLGVHVGRLGSTTLPGQKGPLRV